MPSRRARQLLVGEANLDLWEFEDNRLLPEVALDV
jgi:hypothetical protein